MWKKSLLAILLVTMFLGGCNWNNRAEESPMERTGNDIRNGVNEVGEDVRRGVKDVEETVDPNKYNNDDYDRNVNGNNVTPGTVNPDGTVNNTTPNATDEVKKDGIIIEDNMTDGEKNR